MIFNKANYNDIVKYYSDNIIKLSVTGDRLWQIISIRKEEVSLIDVDGMEIYIDMSEDYQVDFPLPKRAVYQHGSCAALLQRKPAKQYNRGIHNQNTQIKQLGKSSWGSLPISLNTLQQFVDKPAYQDPDNLDPVYNSWAVSPVFSISGDKSLFALDKKIGCISLENKTVELVFDFFKSEVKEVFPTWTIL